MFNAVYFNAQSWIGAGLHNSENRCSRRPLDIPVQQPIMVKLNSRKINHARFLKIIQILFSIPITAQLN